MCLELQVVFKTSCYIKKNLPYGTMMYVMVRH